MAAKKPEQGKKEHPKTEKERVKKLIEEKMEKIRKQELGREKEGVYGPGEKAEQKAKEPAAPKLKETEGGIKKEGVETSSVARSAVKPKETEGGKSRLQSKVKPLPTSVFVTGKRKRAVARAIFRPGKGMIKVNSVPIDLVMPDMFRLKMIEPLMIVGDEWKKFDAKITVNGGGPSGQADAVRQAIARGLSELMGPEARKAFLSYDRNLIVYDSRRTEPHKPPHSSWGPRRYKQRSKR